MHLWVAEVSDTAGCVELSSPTEAVPESAPLQVSSRPRVDLSAHLPPLQDGERLDWVQEGIRSGLEEWFNSPRELSGSDAADRGELGTALATLLRDQPAVWRT